MTHREIANLACRILAVYAFIQAVAAAPHMWTLLSPFNRPEISWLELLQIVLWGLYPIMLLVISVLMWRGSWVMAAWMTGYNIQDHPSEPEGTRQRARLHQIHAVAFSVLGLWVLLDTIPQLPIRIHDTAALIAAAEDEPGSALYLGLQWIETFLRIAAGLWLLFGASGLLKLLTRIRTIGLEHDPLDPTTPAEGSSNR